MMPKIALIEILESDVELINVPFVLYGVYKENANKKLKAAYLKMTDIRKEMAEQYNKIRELEASNDDS